MYDIKWNVWYMYMYLGLNDKKVFMLILKSYLHLYLINWFIGVWMIDRLFDWLMIDCLIDWLNCRLIGWFHWLGRLIGWWIYHLMILLGFNFSNRHPRYVWGLGFKQTPFLLWYSRSLSDFSRRNRHYTTYYCGLC